MNTLSGVIYEIASHQDLTNFKVKVGNYEFDVLTINPNTAQPVHKVGDAVQLLFKETEVILGKGVQVNSLPNQFESLVNSIEPGELLSRIKLNSEIGHLVAIVPSSALEKLQLKAGDQITAMVKINEMMISYD